MRDLPPDHGEERRAWSLRLLLRCSAVLLAFAFPAALLPTPWMAAVHEWLGLGQFPATPIVDYLTRSISLLYGVHGVLLFVLARDVRRYAPVIRYVGGLSIAFGLAMLAVDLHAGFPPAWALCEGPPVAALGGMVLWLARGADQLPPAPA